MKGLLIKEYYSLMKIVCLYIVVLSLYSVFVIHTDGTAMCAYVPVQFGLLGASQISTDEKSGWNRHALMLPCSRGQYVCDIMFHAIVPTTGEAIALIINIEPQRTVHTGYSLVRRGIYYACRMISSQKEVEFTGDDYNNIKKVYTIWLVMDAPKGGSNSIRRYEIKEKILHGHGREDVKNYDLMVAIMVYLGNKATKHRLLKLLHLIFLDKLKAAEKKTILKRDYDLVLTPVMEEELTKMGSLALGIAERAASEGEHRGIKKGEKTGKREGMRITMEAIRMLKENLPVDTIIKKTGLTLQSLTELKAML